MGLMTAKFLAILLTALAFAPGAAHLFALPNKIGLAQEAYLVTQSIYRGWALLGVFTIGAAVANLVLVFMLRGGAGLIVAVLAFLCSATTLVVFFIWTYPANLATDNWTTLPANWQLLRAQWEYSHAVNAALSFAALFLATLAALISPGKP